MTERPEKPIRAPEPMKPEQTNAKQIFVYDRSLTGRYTVEQVAQRVNVTIADVTVLMSKRLLVPMGKPRPSSVKHFHGYEVEQLLLDRKWMEKVERCLDKYWINKNQRKAELKALRLSSSPAKSPPKSGLAS